MTTLHINGKKYGKGKASLTKSLFNTGGTNDGYYKKLKGRIMLYDMQDNPFIAVITHDAQPFIVSCSKHNGKVRYMFSTSTLDEKTLGIEKYSDGIKLAAYIVETTNA